MTTEKKMTYEEYRKQKQNDVNDLPLFWAFTDEQFAQAMRERGLEPTDTDKIYRIKSFGGCFYLKSDADKVAAFFNKKDTLFDLMADPEFAEDAFYYEMANHEYHINYYQGDWDVCSCFGAPEWAGESASGEYYLAQMGYGESTIRAYKAARKRFLHDAEINDWY